ncbi:MAG: B12-binding domain-containing radical SAM protein [Proteobacteria bacterium]|nr:B12-binding domain-containing radical SAM protein [Pseudomonadota bacterium]MBU4469813.1 B12-binding domain-containing radical SAM protein [Pseudomonadota bacterium]MCG2753048.1 B12-binding domain-containing radical SAM protein [Desulfobacteraceae bacterium]
MKVLLIAPPYPLEEFPSPPLGLCYAAAAFEAAGCSVRILDFIVQKYSAEKIKQTLDEFKPDVVGTNSVTMNHNQAVSILKEVKTISPKVIILMGGPHISFDYEASLAAHPEIDMVVIGEGEITIKEIVPVLHDRKAWASIKGIAFLDGGRLVKTPDRELLKDLDTLPHPPRQMLPLSKYLALGLPASIITSRGCPNQCIFCVGRRMVGSKFRTRSVSLIMDEIQELLDMGFEQINFADDFFTVDKKRVKQICAEIKARGLNFGWSIFARADSVDLDVMETMKDAGCHTVLFGIESGNQEILNTVRKRIKIEQIKKAVEISKAAGLRVFGSFIVGLPGETHETLMDSHNLATELDILYGYHFLSPFPGTTLMEEIENYDLEILTDDWSRFDANQAIVRTSSLSPEDIIGFVEEYYNKKIQADEEDLAKRHTLGLCTETELMVMQGNKKMDVVYNLLSKDIIEALATLPASNGGDITLLAESISGLIDRKAEIVEPAITHLVKRGYLKKTEDQGKVRWLWA